MPIFEQGYQHWSGHLSGHAWRWLAITSRGLRSALQGRLVRLCLVLAWLPAIVLTFVICMWGLVERQSELIETIRPFLTTILGTSVLSGPRDYRAEIWTICFHYFLSWELWFSMVLVLLAGPSLISQDLRYNALPLYLSRPLRRRDYFLGKLGVIVALLGMVIIVPSGMAYLMGLLFSLDITIVRDTFRILLASIAFGLVISVSAGTLMLALSSMSRNSRYVALFWMGLWIVTNTVSFVLVQVDQQQRRHASGGPRHAWASEEFLTGEIEAARSNWRPLVSYTANLHRVGEHLLGTNAAWERLSELVPQQQRAALLGQLVNDQHPWQWSAGVLIALLFLSIFILAFSIKSLDRLK
jgi:ABC-2 type transport system permease protein